MGKVQSTLSHHRSSRKQVRPFLPALVQKCYEHDHIAEYSVIAHVLPVDAFYTLALVTLEAVLLRKASHEEVRLE